LALVDRHDYHQVLTELPRAGVTRAADACTSRSTLCSRKQVRFVRTEISGLD
jgi:hypothetical protein